MADTSDFLVSLEGQAANIKLLTTSKLTSTKLPDHPNYGTIHVLHNDIKLSRTTLLLIHGNSSSARIFLRLLSHPSLTQYNLIAFDLPGHGSSTNSPLPAKAYTQKAYASAAFHVLDNFKVPQAIILGWSLGGHIALEMIAQSPSRTAAALIFGSPPVSNASEAAVCRGFTFGLDWRNVMPARDDLSAAEMDTYARNQGDGFEAFMLEDITRCDQQARKVMWEDFAAGGCSDQREIVKGREVLLGVVNGKDDPYIDLEYIRGLEYGRLWKGVCWELDGCKHAPFWGKPELFGLLVEAFVNDVANGDEKFSV
jgi:pimeloyl-ACP methyl ester carboxylesterase